MPAALSHLRELFEAAIALPPHERAQFLARACGDDHALRAEVEALLACDTVAGDPVAASIAAAAANFATQTPWVGRRVGNYRIVRELGSGGMGSVYLAERADSEYESRVAIKLIRGFPSADALERLRRERQVLAGLVHPNIARLLDGGSTEEGQPYLVMEYIEGLPLGTWIEQRQPSLPLRLRVFLELCRAVHHAHQNLIVHRDLKPGNVMVRANNSPALLDFGIAKLTAPDADGTRPTELRAFTEDYASPEQIEGGPVTTASDVYALGLILYELLCGKRYRTGGRSASWRQMRPGRVARAATQPWLRRDAAQVDGDLEHVVRRALADEPEQRYASAAALANDIGRYFAGRPVEAGPDRLGYRMGKFVRRHRVGVAAASLGVVCVVGAALWLAVERNRAVRAERRALVEANTANQVTDFLLRLFKAAGPDNARGKELSARELLDGGRESLGDSLRDEPQVRARLLAALGEIYTDIGQPRRSVEMLEQAVELLRKPGADPLRLAFALNELCRAHTAATEYDAALAACREGLALRITHLRPDHPDLGHSYLSLGVVEQDLNHFDAAGADYRSALRIFSDAGPEYAEDVASAHHNLGFLAAHSEDHAGARREYQIALDAKRALYGELHPKTLNSLVGVANAEGDLGDFAAARRDLEKALALRIQVHGADSILVARSHNDLAGALQDLGDYAAAETHYRATLEIYARIVPADSLDVASTDNNLATLYEDRGDYAAALPLYRRSLEIRALKLKPPHLSLARAEHNLARCLFDSGDANAARALIDSSLATRRAIAAESLERFDSELLLATWQLENGERESAQRAVSNLIAPQGRGNYKRRARWYTLQARIAAAGATWDDARRLQQQALDALRETLAADHPLCARAMLRVAQYAHAQRDDSEARRLLETAQPILTQALSADAPDLRDAAKLAAMLKTVTASPANGG